MKSTRLLGLQRNFKIFGIVLQCGFPGSVPGADPAAPCSTGIPSRSGKLQAGVGSCGSVPEVRPWLQKLLGRVRKQHKIYKIHSGLSTENSAPQGSEQWKLQNPKPKPESQKHPKGGSSGHPRPILLGYSAVNPFISRLRNGNVPPQLLPHTRVTLQSLLPGPF